jgi:hypothetical protein
MSTLAMEYFLATPNTPSETALANLRQCDVMVLVIGFKAGTLLPDGSGGTYTSAEYDECVRLGKDVLVFIKIDPGTEQSVGTWRNEEQDSGKKTALDDFKNRVSGASTPDYFSSPDRLALDVVLSLDQWEARGRPGARKTFASTTEYFSLKNPTGQFHILDFATTLLGREKHIRALSDFAGDPSKRVCILSGRGGIGKSKVLHDWANQDPNRTVFLKDEPAWDGDAETEIPIDCQIVIVDDAHRQQTFGKVLQLIQETIATRNLKLIVSTRPGGASGLLQQVLRKFDRGQVLELPELEELNTRESRDLAEQVLGERFRDFAAHLADVASNTPLVIVAGGRLIATRKIDPSTLTTLDEFRSTIFTRLLDEMDLRGPKFPIDPPLPVLHLITALAPIDVESSAFQKGAADLLAKPVDEILGTVDALSSVGIITPRPKPIRVVPDVLSDFLLEQRCINPEGRSTRYADRVYGTFGDSFLKNLMRNLAELDWRAAQSEQTGLKLLDSIWDDITQRFRSGDEYQRHQIFADLAGGAIYQPHRVLALVRIAIDDPVSVEPDENRSRFRAGQEYVLSEIPSLLEAIAYHPDKVRESVTILWELTHGGGGRSHSAEAAKAALKRLASWQRFKSPAFNFAILLQAIRLARRADAVATDFSPFSLVEQLLEREGEFTEWQDERTMSFGGFGLNYAGVGPVRENALDFLDNVLPQDGIPALEAVRIMKGLLPSFLNRIGRVSSDEEKSWQGKERERCLNALLQRYDQPGSAVLKSKIYDAVRSATAINCPEPIRKTAAEALSRMTVEDEVAVLDAICTAEHELPLFSTEFTEDGWERPIAELMTKGRSSLEHLVAGAGNQARFTIHQTHACIELHVNTGGFHRFMLAFTDRPDFLAEMADQLIAYPQSKTTLRHLPSVLTSIHVADPAAFRKRAFEALRNGAIHVIHAASANLRVFERATEEDIAVIQAYAGYPDPVAKRGAMFAITYMGKFADLRQNLRDAVLSVRTQGDPGVAATLADAFGPYGVPLSSLSRQEADALASEFLVVNDWEVDQGAIPRFLNRFVALFPDETYKLLLGRIELNERARAAGQRSFRTFDLVHQSVSFAGVAAEKRLQLAQDCIGRIAAAKSAEELSQLFWDVAGYDDTALRLLVNIAPTLSDERVLNLATLIGNATPKFAFTNVSFVKDLLAQFTGPRRAQIVDAFAHQAIRFGGGVFAGDPETHMAERQRAFVAQVSSFPEDGLEDLAKALRQFT